VQKWHPKRCQLGYTITTITYTHTKEAIDVEGEVTSEVEASQRGAKASKKELLVPPRMTPSAV
jgi:hypothetical protein